MIFLDVYRTMEFIFAYVKVRKNSRVQLKTWNFINLSVIFQKKDLQKWKDSVSYGKRWIVETVFSSIKRMF
jgi:hypothetical protein